MLAAIFLSLGCGKNRPLESSTTLHRSESDYASDIRTLKKELEAVKTQNIILAARLEEQLAREKRFSEQVNRLKFLNAQQRVQIEALADAPLQRDASIEEAEQLRAEVDRLKQRVEELKAIITVLRGEDADREQ